MVCFILAKVKTKSFFNTLLPRAFKEVKKNKDALCKLDKAMRGYGIEFTYA